MRCPRCQSDDATPLKAKGAGHLAPRCLIALPGGDAPDAAPRGATPLPGFARGTAYRCRATGRRALFAVADAAEESAGMDPESAVEPEGWECGPDTNPAAPPYMRLAFALPFARFYAPVRRGQPEASVSEIAGDGAQLAWAGADSPFFWVFRFNPPDDQFGAEPAFYLTLASASPIHPALVTEDKSAAAGAEEALYLTPTEIIEADHT